MDVYQVVYIGNPTNALFAFEGDAIKRVTIDTSVDIIGDSLATDVMDLEVSFVDADGTLRALPWATPVAYYRDGFLQGKFYLTEVAQIGRTMYRIRTTSAAGIMEYEKFYGGMYSGRAFATFRNVAEQIIGTNGLQPYAGIYRKFRCVQNASIPAETPRAYYMGRRRDQALTVNGGAYWTATMASKLKFKIKINGFHGNDYIPADTGTSYVLPLVGAPKIDNNSESFRHRYGLFMRVDRASTSDPFPEFGTVCFVYNLNLWTLGTPTSAEEAVYDIEFDPMYGMDGSTPRGRLLCNGETQYFFEDLSAWHNDPAALHCVSGGVKLTRENNTIYGTSEPHWTDFETYEYAIYNVDGGIVIDNMPSYTLAAEYVVIKDELTDSLDYYDIANNMYYGMAGVQISVDSTDLTDYDAAVYGANPKFNNRTLFQKDVLSHISYADGIADLKVYGWIPICTKREALHQLLFSQGVVLTKGTDGSILFHAPNSQQQGAIMDISVYETGGKATANHTNRISVTEHAYIYDATSDPVKVYESAGSAETGAFIAEFTQAPVAELTAFDMGIYCYNCNAAYVTDAGSITARLYQHNEAVRVRQIDNYPSGQDISYPSATLVTLQNSETVLDRLTAYYSSAKTVNIDIVSGSERCGLLYAFTTAFGEAATGFLTKASKTVSAIIKAVCTFVCGYTPPAVGSGYKNYIILTGGGTWTVPVSVFEEDTPRIRVVLIGGGTGGSSGYAGEDGQACTTHSGTTAAQGGAAGAPGSGGKILDVTITSPAASYAYSCGLGGAGGAISTSSQASNPGSAGGDSAFSGGGDSYSSASGAAKDGGVTNFFTGDRYAIKPVNETTARSSAGGNGGYVTVDNGSGTQHSGERVVCDGQIYYSGRLGGGNLTIDGGVRVTGGCDGGAAGGENGSDGGNGRWSNSALYGGAGGNGGDATRIPQTLSVYGAGGLGGNGGGGGGSGGFASDFDQYMLAYPGAGGYGGHGGQGGDGADGCILIYY